MFLKFETRKYLLKIKFQLGKVKNVIAVRIGKDSINCFVGYQYVFQFCKIKMMLQLKFYNKIGNIFLIIMMSQ